MSLVNEIYRDLKNGGKLICGNVPFHLSWFFPMTKRNSTIFRGSQLCKDSAKCNSKTFEMLEMISYKSDSKSKQMIE